MAENAEPAAVRDRLGRLLVALIGAPGETLFIDHADWERAMGIDLSRVRVQTEPEPADPTLIKIGYELVAPDEAAPDEAPAVPLPPPGHENGGVVDGR